jgi:hypothetical protein
MDERLREACGLQPPSAFVSAISWLSLTVRRLSVKFLFLPRNVSARRTAAGLSSVGSLGCPVGLGGGARVATGAQNSARREVFVPCWHVFDSLYAEGYAIEELGNGPEKKFSMGPLRAGGGAGTGSTVLDGVEHDASGEQVNALAPLLKISSPLKSPRE